MCGSRHSQDDFFADHLNAAREIHLTLCERRFGNPGPTAEKLIECRARHREPAQVIEILLVENERSVITKIHEMIVNRIDVSGFAVGREAHHLVLAGVHLESALVRERRIEQAERIGPVKLTDQVDVIPLSDSDRRSCPFADTVDGENRGLFER